ncbi:MAG: S9 family peptidase [Gammaproteobacteria bacterium]
MRPLLLGSLLFVVACAPQSPPLPEPPVAEVREYQVEAPHGASRVDEYYWLRDDKRENPEMLAYLNAENAYADAVLAPLEGVRDDLYTELVGRLKQDDATVPYRYKGYWYYTRYEEGREYPIHARREGSMDAPEEVLLDVNALAEGHGYYNVGYFKVSPDQRLLAYFEDTVGRRQYTLRIKDLTTGELMPTEIRGLSSSLAWVGNDKLFYTQNDPETLLTKRIFMHYVDGRAPDVLVYEEADDSFYIGAGATRSEAYACVYMQSTLSSRQMCTETANPGHFRWATPQDADVEYEADHLGDRWVIRTNWDAKNFKLMEVSEHQLANRNHWRDLVPHDDTVFVSGFELFDGFVAIGERSNALTRIRILDENDEAKFIAADEPAFTMSLSINAEADTDWVRYTYTSLTTPTTWYEVNVTSNERRLLKEEPVLGGFDKDDYVTERQWATARDGTRVPVSVLYHKDFKKDGEAALLQYGYGSYGFSMDPRFNSNVISLVDRGMVYAIAHIRGGQEMGRDWYEAGKLMNKVNTFTDFIDVTDFLVAEGYAHPERVAALGGSAGGLLMGAIANMAAEKYRVILSLVPFVDVVTTMLDESIPLTTNEFDEWGNPKDAASYEYMLTYSPYDQLGAKDYPAMFIGTGLWDSQVQYWEPAKYVARLRARRTDDDLLVFRTQMEAGHGGRSGRFQRYHEIAEYYAFMLDQLGVVE